MMKPLLDSPILRSLLVVNFLLFALLAVPMVWPLPTLTDEGDQNISAADIADYLGETDIDISTAIERPLFHSNRRKPVAEVAAPVVVAAPVEVEQPLTLELVGVMGASAEARTAFLHDSASAVTHTVKTGQVVVGWTITAISPNTVSISKDDRQEILSMN